MQPCGHFGWGVYFLFIPRSGCAMMKLINKIFMKKVYFSLAIIFSLLADPVLAASQSGVIAKPTGKFIIPEGYTAITWASALGVNSFFKMPTDNGAVDFLTRIHLPQNQINFILSTTTPIDLSSADLVEEINFSTATDISDFHNLSFKRIGAEQAKTLAPTIKFLWDAPFFNVKPVFSDLSMAVKYTVGATTTITSGSRSLADMALPRRMLIIDNKNRRASIQDFDSAA